MQSPKKELGVGSASAAILPEALEQPSLRMAADEGSHFCEREKRAADVG